MTARWWCAVCKKWVVMVRSGSITQCVECRSGRVRPPMPSEDEESRL